MIIGVPKEIKNNENRVALTPAGVAELKKMDIPYMYKQQLERAVVLTMKNIPKPVRKYFQPLKKSTPLLK